MIEKLIEANIIAAIEALNLDGLVVRGAWQTAADGTAKDLEADSSPAAAFVKVSPRSYGDYSLPIVTIPCAVSVSVRSDKDPRGLLLPSVADGISGLLAGWHETVCVGDTAFAVDGFAPAAVGEAGGDGPDYDREAGKWALTFNFNVIGTLVPVATT